MRTKCLLLTWMVVLHTARPTPLTLFQSVTTYYRNSYQRTAGDMSGKKILHHGAYDFIVIGAGSSGSVIANRLSEDPSTTVLLLEAGKDESFLTDIPILSGYFQLTDYNWGYSTEPQKSGCLGMTGGRCQWPRGKALGGSSVINFMMYTRGHNKDYDDWAKHGNTGWSYEHVLPYFKKSENIQIPELMGSSYHSSGGYMNVERIPYRSLLGEAFLAAGQELGLPTVDYNGKDLVGVSPLQVTMRRGQRCSAAKAFLKPIRNRTNRHVSLNARVLKVVIDPNTKIATGVKFVKNRLTYEVRAKREVIVSAGALNSPQILMLSGIGPKQHLQELGIPVISDLKVGHNLQEHAGFLGLIFLVNASVGLSARDIQSPAEVLRYVVNGTGLLTSPGGAEALGYVRTKHAEDERPDVEFVYTSSGLNSDGGKQVREWLGIREDLYEQVYRSIDNRHVWSIWPLVMRPKSRGVVKLKDKNPFHWPTFHPNFFSDPGGQDLATVVEGIKIALKLAETSAFQRYGSKLHSVPIPGCEAHVFGSDDYWACATKHLTAAFHHQAGTCKMGPSSDPDAVVDPELRVYGVRQLRVADASIMPQLPTAHLNAPAFMIGEKLSDLIKHG